MKREERKEKKNISSLSFPSLSFSLMANLATVSVVPYGGFGEETQVLNDELLHRLVAAQAPEAVRAYGRTAGAEDKDVMYLRVDFQCALLGKKRKEKKR